MASTIQPGRRAKIYPTKQGHSAEVGVVLGYNPDHTYTVMIENPEIGARKFPAENVEEIEV